MKKIALSILIISLSTALSYSATLVGYDTVAGTTVTPVELEPNILGINLTRGSGISAAGGNTFNSNAWSDSSTLAEAITNEDYLEFGLVLAPGIQASNLSAGFFGDRSATGPSSIEVFFSTDNFATQTSVLTATDVGITGSIQNTDSITANLTGAVTFRIYGYGGSSTAGTFDIEDTGFDGTFGLVINGDLSAIPEPSTSSLIGLAALFIIRRRKR